MTAQYYSAEARDFSKNPASVREPKKNEGLLFDFAAGNGILTPHLIG